MFENADIREVGSDSLLVTIGDQVIGIHVPGGPKNVEVPASKKR